jgi:hypothetical protein
MPRDLYPEWTSHPHRVHGPPAPVDVLERPEAPARPQPRTRVGLVAFLLVVAGLALAFVIANRRATHSFFPGSEPDTRVEEAARLRVQSESDLRDLDVMVVVRDQVATVSGRVPDKATREKVLNVVRMTPNVTGVIDHVQVGEPAK